MKAENFEYETKCRRCGELETWHFSTRAAFSWFEFAKAMTDYIANPRQSMCKKCEKQTVQDVVAYTEF